jgi:hypothetical protein
MTIKPLHIILFLISITPIVLSNEEKPDFPPEVQKKIDEMQNYSPITGTWIGQYFAKSLPELEFEKNETIETKDFLKNGVKVKIIISNADVQLFLKYKPEDDWKELKGSIKIDRDALGFQIRVYRDSSVWIERYFFSIARTAENTGKIITTRSVHNWFGNETKETEFFSIYSEGDIKKLIEGIEE